MQLLKIYPDIAIRETGAFIKKLDSQRVKVTPLQLFIMKEGTFVSIICGERISRALLYYRHKKTFYSVETKTWISSFKDDFKQ